MMLAHTESRWPLATALFAAVHRLTWPFRRRPAPVIGCQVLGCHCVLIGGITKSEADLIAAFRTANGTLRGERRPRA
jgi:hypothetical protein